MLNIMKINGKIQLTFKDLDSMETAYQSLEIDNKGFVKSKKNNNKITYYVESDSLGSFLSTVDDLIASEIVVEKIITTTIDNK